MDPQARDPARRLRADRAPPVRRRVGLPAARGRVRPADPEGQRGRDGLRPRARLRRERRPARGLRLRAHRPPARRGAARDGALRRRRRALPPGPAAASGSSPTTRRAARSRACGSSRRSTAAAGRGEDEAALALAEQPRLPGHRRQRRAHREPDRPLRDALSARDPRRRGAGRGASRGRIRGDFHGSRRREAEAGLDGIRRSTRAEFEVQTSDLVAFARACGEIDARYTDPAHPDFQAVPNFTSRYVGRRVLPDSFPRLGEWLRLRRGQVRDPARADPRRATRSSRRGARSTTSTRRRVAPGRCSSSSTGWSSRNQRGEPVSIVDWRMVQQERGAR